MKILMSTNTLLEHILSTQHTLDLKKLIYKLSPNPYLLFVIKDLQRELDLCKRRYVERVGLPVEPLDL